MSGRQRRRQSGTGPASPAQEQEAVGEGELARVLAAVERRYEQRWRRVHITAVSLQFIDGFGSGGWPAGGDVHGREACPTFVHPCTSTRESLFFALGFGVMCV